VTNFSASLLTVGLETALNQYLRLDPENLVKLVALSGKVYAVELSGSDLTFYLLPEASGFRVVSEAAGEPDVRIRATATALLRLARGDKVLGAEVDIKGDTDLASDLRDVLSGVDIDWEEHISRLLGDVAAHRLGNLLRGAFGWGRQAGETVLHNAAEYLQQESCDLPAPETVERFLDTVDRLRNDVDRLEARIRRLQRSRSHGDG
jgi:ubiquinone biosynthesis protein UbiJ